MFRQEGPILDPHSGEVRHAEIFVGVLGASSLAYAEASWTARRQSGWGLAQSELHSDNRYPKMERATMLADSRLYDSDPDFDSAPVVKIFSPVVAATWLLCSLHRGDPDIADGLCDLGFGCPEIGFVRLSELASVALRLGLRPERDLYVKPSKTLSQYADDARVRGLATSRIMGRIPSEGQIASCPTRGESPPGTLWSSRRGPMVCRRPSRRNCG